MKRNEEISRRSNFCHLLHLLLLCFPGIFFLYFIFLESSYSFFKTCPLMKLTSSLVFSLHFLCYIWYSIKLLWINHWCFHLSEMLLSWIMITKPLASPFYEEEHEAQRGYISHSGWPGQQRMAPILKVRRLASKAPSLYRCVKPHF